MVLFGEKKMGEVENLVEQITKTEEIQSPSNCIKQPVSSDFEMGKKKIPPPEEVAKFLPEVVISGGWNKCWVEDVTPWDLGCPTPLVVHLVQTGVLPKGRGLVPGCGGGYDVVAMASSERYVVGLDISENAVKKAIETHSSRQNANAFSFMLEDFFTWRPVDLFDFVFDYVFFCAIEPDMRAAWGRSMSELLKPDGELITLMYPIGEHDGGPPYKVSVSDYEAALVPLGFRLVSIQDNELAVGPRKGREKLGRWKKIPPPEEVARFLPEVVISGGWDKCWVEDVTPWDLGRPTPLVVRLVETGVLPKGRGLVPGCGGGHDVVAMASSERFVVGLDISENALEKAVETHASRQNATWFSFVLEDFFTWRPTELFDFVFDYVFFCAIEPDMRAAWGKSMSELLKPDGELITLMYPIGEHDGGPPYKVSVSDYEEVLIPLGFRPVSIEDNELAVGPRKGKEKLGRWKKMAAVAEQEEEDANPKE